MGGLFSSEPEPRPTPRPTPVRNYSYDYEAQRSVRQSISSTNTAAARPTTIAAIRRDLLLNHDGNIAGAYRQSSRQVKAPVQSVRDLDTCLIRSDPYFNTSKVVTYIPLSEYDTEYRQIARKITNKQNFKIDGIEKIENPYLKRAYELKKEQKEMKCFVEEQLLFHGTTHANFDKICKFNFDWRLCKAHKFGKGVSFSPNSTYASNYSDKIVHNKVMIVAKVLIGGRCTGNEHMVLPDDGCDTSQKDTGVVIVKYEDNEFLPVYKINYHLMRENVGKPRRNVRGGRIVVQHNYYDDAFDLFDY